MRHGRRELVKQVHPGPQNSRTTHSAIGRVRVRGDRFHRHLACEEILSARFTVYSCTPIQGGIITRRTKERADLHHPPRANPEYYRGRAFCLSVCTALCMYIPVLLSTKEESRRPPTTLFLTPPLRHTARSCLPTVMLISPVCPGHQSWP
jgi:hypothetical protein